MTMSEVDGVDLATHTAEELRAYVALFATDESWSREIRLDFDVEDAVAHVDTDDRHLHAELHGVGFPTSDDAGDGDGFEVFAREAPLGFSFASAVEASHDVE